MSALNNGPAILHNALFSDDTRIMLKALRTLGFKIRENEAAATIEVQGEGGRIPVRNAALHVGNSGTSARFLTALCCLADSGRYRIDGVEQMKQRPIGGLVEVLRSAGSRIDISPGGGLPLTIRPSGLDGGPTTLDATASSQLLSALLMVAPFTAAPLRIHLLDPNIRRGYVNMTMIMMREFGIDDARFNVTEDTFTIEPGEGYCFSSGSYEIESDASAASYFLALPLVVGGHLEIEHLRIDGLQSDATFAQIIRTLGGEVTETAAGVRIAFDDSEGALPGITRDFFQMSDTFLTLAALAPLLRGSTTITGIAKTRKQETDRVSAVATELKKLGQDVEESEDTLTIHPRPLRAAAVETYHDHRIAMSFSILGCHDLHGNGRPWLTLLNPATCAKTFPTFFQILDDVRNSE